MIRNPRKTILVIIITIITIVFLNMMMMMIIIIIFIIIIMIKAPTVLRPHRIFSEAPTRAWHAKSNARSEGRFEVRVEGLGFRV